MADNDDAREALEEAEVEEASGETGDTDAEEAESGETTEGATPEPEAEETSNQSGDDSEGATAESVAEQIAALAARIDGIVSEIAEIRRWFKMSTVEEGSEDGPEDLSFDALADFIIGEN